MKLIVALGLILICCNVWAIEINGKYDGDKLKGFLEKVKILIKTGNETLGIPVLDPFTQDRLEININEDGLNLNGLLTNINVKGLSEYDINAGDYNIKLPLKIILTVNLSWPLITANTKYNIKGKMDDFEIYGDGTIDMAARGFGFDTEIQLGINGQHFKINDLKLKLDLESLNLHITGLYNDEEISTILSAMISDMASDIVRDVSTASKIIPFVQKILDDFLSSKTISEILKIIGGGLYNIDRQVVKHLKI
ncbi:hypothetical protein P5V15_007842 [Pogonomyrmex californicus]